MKLSLRSVLEQWTSYRRAADDISGYLMEGRYAVSRLRLLNGSLEAVQQQVSSLEVGHVRVNVMATPPQPPLRHRCYKHTLLPPPRYNTRPVTQQTHTPYV